MLYGFVMTQMVFLILSQTVKCECDVTKFCVCIAQMYLLSKYVCIYCQNMTSNRLFVNLMYLNVQFT